MTSPFLIIIAIVATVVSMTQAQDPHQRVLHQTQAGGTNEPVICASCVQRTDTCTYSLCSGRAGIKCEMHSCSSPLTSENGTELRLALCYGVYFNADGRVMQGCFTALANKTGEACPEVWQPVCGADGTTYPSSCHAATQKVEATSNGLCTSSPDTPDNTTACPAVWAPVCSSGNTTYSSSCTAKAAGVTDFASGACKNGTLGTGNVTQTADTRNKTSPSASLGSSPGPSPTTVLCPTVYQPVCGPGNITYNNTCEAAKQLALNTTQGACKASAAAALVGSALSTATLGFLASAAIWAALTFVV